MSLQRIQLFSICLCISAVLCVVVAGERMTVSLSPEHLIVWFDHNVRFYEEDTVDAYSTDDLAAMVKVASTQFKRLILEPVPPLKELPKNENEDQNQHIPSGFWLPSIVAEFNKNASDRSQINSIITYSINWSFRFTATTNMTSLDVAKSMADRANKIHPGTVDTIVLASYSVFPNTDQNIMNVVTKELTTARSKLTNGSSNLYKLGVIIDLRACGSFRGPLGQLAQKIAPLVDTIIVIIRRLPYKAESTFTPRWPQDPDVGVEMFKNYFNDCERKLKEVRQDIVVIPLAGYCDTGKNSAFGTDTFSAASISKGVQCWQKMSDWAKSNRKDVVMYGAFDLTKRSETMFKSVRDLDGSKTGWWRLRDKSEYDLTENSFMEKLSDLTNVNDYNSDKDLSPGSSGKAAKVETRQECDESTIIISASYPTGKSRAVCVMSVICMLLVPCTTGLLLHLYRLTRNKRLQGKRVVQQARHFGEDRDPMINISFE